MVVEAWAHPSKRNTLTVLVSAKDLDMVYIFDDDLCNVRALGECPHRIDRVAVYREIMLQMWRTMRESTP